MKRLASSGVGIVSPKNDTMVFRHSFSGLQTLPYEMMANVAMSLSIEEVFDLSLCSRHFQYIITEDSFCKAIVLVSRFSDAGSSEYGLLISTRQKHHTR